jgi:hypothetical protein
MKKVTLMAIAILFSIATVFAASIHPVKAITDTTKKATSAKVVYTCPMHTDVVSYKPGKCPKPHCGMTMVKKADLKKKPATMKM